MSGKPAARVTDPTTCPLPGHGTNPIASGSPDVFFNGLAAARLGDTCTCGQALSGAFSATVLINGKNAMTLDSTASHGGVVVGPVHPAVADYRQATGRVQSGQRRQW